ncbi:MAG: hypothetical protein K9G33_05270 [Sneathiella sp.]|nr:hypothetical protein [Sneathiella sp.]
MTGQTPDAAKLMSPAALGQVISRLSDILKEENILLSDNNPKSFSASLAEKTRLVAIYNQQMSLIKKNPETYRAYPKADIDSLKKISEVFYAVLDTHFRKLSTVKTVTEGLVKSVADEIAKKKAPPRAYNSLAAISNPLANKNTRAVNGAIVINQVV